MKIYVKKSNLIIDDSTLLEDFWAFLPDVLQSEHGLWYNTYKSKQKDGASDGRQNERGE